MKSVLAPRANCEICGFVEPATVRCAGCMICFHVKCYGSINSPFGDRSNKLVYCQKCWFSKQTRTPPYQIKCFLCPLNHGAMKRVSLPGLAKQVWVHVKCIIFQTYFTFKEAYSKKGIALNKQLIFLTMNFQDIKEMWKKQCVQCFRSEGGVLNCSKKIGSGTCRNSFHVSCIQTSKHLMAMHHLQVECNKNNNPNEAVRLFCSYHLKQRLFNYRSQYLQKGYETKNSFILNDIYELYETESMDPQNINAQDFINEHSNVHTNSGSAVNWTTSMEKVEKVRTKACRKSGKKEFSKRQTMIEEPFNAVSVKIENSIQRRSSRLRDSKQRSSMKRRRANMHQILNEDAQIITLTDSNEALQPRSIRSLSMKTDQQNEDEQQTFVQKTPSAANQEDCKFYYSITNQQYQNPSWPSYDTILNVIGQDDLDLMESLNKKLKE